MLTLVFLTTKVLTVLLVQGDWRSHSAMCFCHIFRVAELIPPRPAFPRRTDCADKVRFFVKYYVSDILRISVYS